MATSPSLVGVVWGTLCPLLPPGQHVASAAVCLPSFPTTRRRCSDPRLPSSSVGIGLPAVAASGAVTANSLVSVGQHTALLKELGL